MSTILGTPAFVLSNDAKNRIFSLVAQGGKEDQEHALDYLENEMSKYAQNFNAPNSNVNSFALADMVQKATLF